MDGKNNARNIIEVEITARECDIVEIMKLFYPEMCRGYMCAHDILPMPFILEKI